MPVLTALLTTLVLWGWKLKILSCVLPSFFLSVQLNLVFSTKSEQVNIEPTVCVRCNLTEKKCVGSKLILLKIDSFFCELRSRSLKGEIPVLFLDSRTKKKSVVSPSVFKVVENFCIKFP